MAWLRIGAALVLLAASWSFRVPQVEKSRGKSESEQLGEKVYREHCLSCHQANGSGVPYTYPPLARADWVSGPQEYLIQMLLQGISGPFYVNGELFDDEMPAYDYLTDREIAAVLTYIRKNFGNQAGPVTPEEVARVRALLQEETPVSEPPRGGTQTDRPGADGAP